MLPLFEPFGWGLGAVDHDPPLSAEGDIARWCRETALRYVLEALHDNFLAIEIEPLFRRATDNQRTPHAELVRFLCLAHRLLEVELPSLRRSLRCQSACEPRWMKAPRGGRVDPLGTARASPLTPDAPGEWLVWRTERCADTPVNRLLAAILHDTIDRIERAGRGVEADTEAMHREQHLLRRVALAIRRFLSTTPLGAVPVDEPPFPERLLAHAERRRAELDRARGLVRWWRELQEIDLAQIAPAGRAESMQTISVHGCYELLVMASLLLALRRRLRPGDRAPGALTVNFNQGPSRLAVDFGASPVTGIRGRGVTAALRIENAGHPSHTLLVDARNAGGIAADDAADRLEMFARLHAREGTVRCVLITPREQPKLTGGFVESHPIPVDPTGAGAVQRWSDILAVMLPALH